MKLGYFRQMMLAIKHIGQVIFYACGIIKLEKSPLLSMRPYQVLGYNTKLCRQMINFVGLMLLYYDLIRQVFVCCR